MARLAEPGWSKRDVDAPSKCPIGCRIRSLDRSEGKPCMQLMYDCIVSDLIL